MSTNTITTKDGTQIFYKDWGGTGQPVVFSHGWPLTADVWDNQMDSVASNGYRAIAHDRRGGGRSSQPWDGNNLDTYADDLATLIETLDLKDVVLVGHSTGGGEVTRYFLQWCIHSDFEIWRIKDLKGETFKQEIPHLWMVECFAPFLPTLYFMIRPPCAKFRTREHEIMDQLSQYTIDAQAKCLQKVK